MIGFACENCGHTMRVEDSFAGKTGRCRKCGEQITVPILESSQSRSIETAESNVRAHGIAHNSQRRAGAATNTDASSGLSRRNKSVILLVIIIIGVLVAIKGAMSFSEMLTNANNLNAKGNVNEDSYEEIQDWTTYDDVVNLLGFEGTRISAPSEMMQRIVGREEELGITNVTTYEWVGFQDRVIRVLMVDEKMAVKLFSGQIKQDDGLIFPGTLIVEFRVLHE